MKKRFTEGQIVGILDQVAASEKTIAGARCAAGINGFGRQYNQERPHSSLGYQTPAEFAARLKQKQESGSGVAAVDLGSAQTRDLSPVHPPVVHETKAGRPLEAAGPATIG